MMAKCSMLCHVLVLASIIRVNTVDAQASSVISGGSGAIATAATAAATTAATGASTATSSAKTAQVLEKPFDNAEEKVKELESILHYIKNNNHPRQCSDLLRAGQRNDGIYTIYHNKAPQGQDVYCNMKADGGGWTVIQRRGQFKNRVFHFYRNWTEYANGFGDPSQEYWIGNEALNAMTSGKRDMTLRIVLRNTTSDKVSIYYSKFRVSNGAKMYQLEMGNFIGPQGWDAMRHADGQKFSTYDQDNDVSTYNCAEQYRGAWWYSDCHACNPNGLNLNGYHESYGDGIEWSIREHTGKLYYYSYPYMEMMIRPARLLEGKEKDLKFFPKQ
uniref:Putative ixoderin n=1 Tax=Rhipicephalus microplus TaxID=6941 RepID=A0A6G5A8E9_RHIMP